MTPSSSTHASSPITSEFAGDLDMQELINLFVDELPGRIRAIQEALDARRLDEVARLTHQLKGAGGGYGFTPVSQAAGAVEGVIRSGPDASARLGLIAAEVEALTRLCARVRVQG